MSPIGSDSCTNLSLSLANWLSISVLQMGGGGKGVDSAAEAASTREGASLQLASGHKNRRVKRNSLLNATLSPFFLSNSTAMASSTRWNKRILNSQNRPSNASTFIEHFLRFSLTMRASMLALKNSSKLLQTSKACVFLTTT